MEIFARFCKLSFKTLQNMVTKQNCSHRSNISKWARVLGKYMDPRIHGPYIQTIYFFFIFGNQEFLKEVPLHIDLHKYLSTSFAHPTISTYLKKWFFLIYVTALGGVTHFSMDWGSACQDLSEKVQHATLACMCVLFVITFVALLYDNQRLSINVK